MFERWAETVCGLAPARASRPSLGPMRTAACAERDKGGGNSISRGDKMAQGLAAQQGVFRDAVAAAAASKLSAPSTSSLSLGGGGVGGLYQRSQRSRQWKQGREGNWGVQTAGSSGNSGARVQAAHSHPHSCTLAPSNSTSMLYRDRYQDSWERVLSTVPSVFGSMGRDFKENAAALTHDMQHSTHSPPRHGHSEYRSDSEPPLSVQFAHADIGGGGRGGANESIRALSSEIIYSSSAGASRGSITRVGIAGRRTPLLYDPDEDRGDSQQQYASWREQLCSRA